MIGGDRHSRSDFIARAGRPKQEQSNAAPQNDTRAASLLVKSATSALFCEPDAI